METSFHFPDLRSWRAWLVQNHASSDGVWIRYYKKHTGRLSISYNDTVEEALCWGWIDSLIKRVDDDIYLRKLSPRRQRSNWSASNRRRVKKLLAEGRMQPAGLALIEGVDLDAEPANPTTAASVNPPPLLAAALANNSVAREHFEKLPSSHKKRYIAWIMDAKREETRRRRAAEALRMLASGDRLGLK